MRSGELEHTAALDSGPARLAPWGPASPICWLSGEHKGRRNDQGVLRKAAWGPVLMAGHSREKTEDAEQGRAESGSDTRDSPTAADARLHHGRVTGGAWGRHGR